MIPLKSTQENNMDWNDEGLNRLFRKDSISSSFRKPTKQDSDAKYTKPSDEKTRDESAPFDAAFLDSLPLEDVPPHPTTTRRGRGITASLDFDAAFGHASLSKLLPKDLPPRRRSRRSQTSLEQTLSASLSSLPLDDLPPRVLSRRERTQSSRNLDSVFYDDSPANKRTSRKLEKTFSASLGTLPLEEELSPPRRLSRRERSQTSRNLDEAFCASDIKKSIETNSLSKSASGGTSVTLAEDPTRSSATAFAA